MIQKFRKKPVVIEAVQFDGTNGMEIETWSNRQACLKTLEVCPANPFGTYIYVNTEEGLMIGIPGDWIIKGLIGEFYPCKPDVFELTYEPAE